MHIIMGEKSPDKNNGNIISVWLRT